MNDDMNNELSLEIRRNAHMVVGDLNDYDALGDMFNEAKVVLLGESSHGTQEFYHERARITKRLIMEHGFNAIAIEADWPDAHRVNQYIKGASHDSSATKALDGFKRFPTWMWCNQVVLSFVTWLYQYNQLRGADKQVGFYGLDLYSLHASMAAVVEYLKKVDPEAAKRAQHRYACFDHYGINPQNYAYATAFSNVEDCENEVIQQLQELRNKTVTYLNLNGRVAADEFFFAEQNAKLVKNVEKYYRLMFNRDVSSWNLRDRHMMDTLEALDKHITNLDGSAKIVVWAHNSHIGDASATEMGTRGEFNIGQLAREHYGELSVNIGFTTYTGTVTAASDWDEPGQRRRVRPALPGSYESVMHGTGLDKFYIKFDDKDAAMNELLNSLRNPRLERAIGVIYRPESERVSHYFLASMPDQFDAVVHIDTTHALEPLDLIEHWQVNEEPETYPFGV